LKRRRRSRKKLIDYTEYTFPQYQAEKAHKIVGNVLDWVVNGWLKKLIILAPPQHGKSELVSVRLPVFWLSKNPDLPVILTSYAASLAESKSKQARALIESAEHKTLFPKVGLNPALRSVEQWGVAGHRGYMKVAGVGGPITGHGAGLGIIDDPFENWEQAQSENTRKVVWDWYQKTFRTRIWENGAIVMIMTRWHKDDLAGKLIEDQGGYTLPPEAFEAEDPRPFLPANADETWLVVRLPAMAETQEERDNNNEFLGLPVGEKDPLRRKPGVPLCPKRYSLFALQALKREVGSMGWAAEYQGVPRAGEGNRFKREWFTVVDQAPAEAIQNGTLIRYWDNAATQDAGCYTAGVLLCLHNFIIYILDVVRGQWGSDARNAIMLNTTKIDGSMYNMRVMTWFEQEGGASGKDVALATVRLLAGYAAFGDPPTGSKDVRLMPFEGQAGVGNLRIIKGRWNRDYMEEFLAIPNGTYRDQADATSGAYNKAALGNPDAGAWIRAVKNRSKKGQEENANIPEPAGA
jgi:phage terminase large subunit-like protein